MSLRKKVIGDNALFEFIKTSFIEIQENAYIEKVPPSVCDNSVWYLLYFVTCQVKKRIIYDGSATFDAICINDYLSSGPHTLNHLSDILARFRVGKFAFTADITKCFFQVECY